MLIEAFLPATIIGHYMVLLTHYYHVVQVQLFVELHSNKIKVTNNLAEKLGTSGQEDRAWTVTDKRPQN